MDFFHNLLELSLSAAPWLLFGLILGGLIKAWIPQSFLHRHLGGHGFVAVSKAALLGAPFPLCSCGVVPAALGLRKAGASREATVSFLISTPETGVDSVPSSRTPGIQQALSNSYLQSESLYSLRDGWIKLHHS